MCKFLLDFFFAHSLSVSFRWERNKIEQRHSKNASSIVIIRGINKSQESQWVLIVAKGRNFTRRVRWWRDDSFFRLVFFRFAAINYTSEKWQQRDMAFHYQDCLRASIEYVLIHCSFQAQNTKPGKNVHTKPLSNHKQFNAKAYFNGFILLSNFQEEFWMTANEDIVL